MVSLISEFFDIEQIASSGQCFRIDKIDFDIWHVYALNGNVQIQKKIYNGDKIHLFYSSQEKFDKIWNPYFDLNVDYKIFQQRIYKTKDEYLIAAMQFGKGIRILRQDLWEMIVSFVISQQNNIPRIKSCIKKLCDINDGQFPSAEDFLKFNSNQLHSVKLGYREHYLLKISEVIVDKKFFLEDLKRMSYVTALKHLKTLYGVGDKVANCIALFGLHHMNAFPVDVWMKKIINKHYNGNFYLDKYDLKDIGGLVQQYMFFYERSLKDKNQ